MINIVDWRVAGGREGGDANFRVAGGNSSISTAANLAIGTDVNAGAGRNIKFFAGIQNFAVVSDGCPDGSGEVKRNVNLDGLAASFCG